jgi:hypothetical protein
VDNKKAAVAIIIVGALAVIFVYYVLINQSIESASKEKKDASTLSDFQVTACNAADRGGTCRTKLQKLNLITPEECCKYLGKCCQNRG